MFQDEILALITGYEDVYSVVDGEIDDVLSSEDFKNADLEEQKEVVEDALMELEKEGKIEEGSIQWNDDSELYAFTYSDGTWVVCLLQKKMMLYLEMIFQPRLLLLSILILLIMMVYH
ncbi:MAG: type II toxin-antitoxin system VapB family antitoxin [Ruminococcus sp.]|nr:type II toxin-antitoxin system VapB family antitoxin [Ruminococcus sp.]